MIQLVLNLRQRCSMIKILFIVPYPQLAESIDKKIDFSNLKNHFQDDFALHLLIPVTKGDKQDNHISPTNPLSNENFHYVTFSEKEFDEIVTKEIERLKINFDIIIARGHTTERLRKSQSIPVITLQMTGYDIIQALMECIEHYSPKKICILTHNNLIYNTDSFERLLGIEIESMNLPDLSKIDNLISKALDDGCEAIIGGYTTYTSACSKKIPSTFIKTGENSVLLAIEEAIRTHNILQKEREMYVSYQTIIHSSHFGIIKVDHESFINLANNRALQLLNLGSQKIIGEHLSSVFQPLSSYVLHVLNTGKSIQNTAINTEKTTISSSILPIIVKDNPVGAIIYLQSITDIQKSETEIRKKIFSRGFEAKYSFSNIIFQSESMEKVITIAKQYARANSNILLFGESGTGKELFAQSIHNFSNRSSGPFVPVNCAAISENLLESELFGYAEGAFTGAKKGGKPGLFELAHNGTLFLDEIGEMPPATQSKLLRVLQEKEVRRVGGDTVIPIDVRIITATNRNIDEMITNHEFREDLLFRLDVLRLVIPPLRSRKEDIEPLLRYFIERNSISNGFGIPQIDQSVIDTIKNLPFKGNIRELQNLAERLCVTQSEGRITTSNLEMILASGKPITQTGNISEPLVRNDMTLENSREKNEKELILKVLDEVKGNKIQAAKVLGINRSSLYRKISKYGILSNINRVNCQTKCNTN